MLHSSKQRFFLYIRSRKQPTWQPSHCRSFEFFAQPTQVASILLPIFPVPFRIFNSLFQDSLFHQITVFFKTTLSIQSNIYQSFSRLRLFIFLIFIWTFFIQLMSPFPLRFVFNFFYINHFTFHRRQFPEISFLLSFSSSAKLFHHG